MKNKSLAGLYLLLIAIAAISMAYYVAGAVALREEFFHSSHYAREPFDFGDDGQTLQDVHKEALSAGVANGDLLLGMNGEPFTGYAQFHRLLLQVPPGQSIPIVLRTPSGAVRSTTVRIAPREGPEFSLWGYIGFLAPVLGVPLLGLLAGYWIVAGRPYDLNAWLVLVLLAFPETAYGNLDWKFWPEPWYLLLGLWNVLVQIFVFPALVWFGFLFPERWRVDARLPWIKHVVLAASVCSFILELGFIVGQFAALKAIRNLMLLQHWADRLSSWLQVLCILLFLAAIFDKLRSASTADARRRLRVLAVGSGLSLGPLLLLFLIVPLFGQNPHHGNWFSIIVPFLALFPLTLAYVLVVQRAMEVRILLRMGTRYLLARASLLIVEFALVAFVISRFLVTMSQRREHPLANFLLLALCIGVVFFLFVQRNSLSSRLQQWLDRKFFREAYNSEVLLSELSQEVRHLTDKTPLLDTVLQRIAEVLHLSQAAILLRGQHAFALEHALGISGPVLLSESSATVQNLLRTQEPATIYSDRPEPWLTDAPLEEQALLRHMQTELLLPMSGRDGLVGLMALGPKRSEQPYTPTDLRTLQSVAAQTGLTLELVELIRTVAEQAAQRERMNREIEIARQVQERLFPQSLPEIAGLSLAGMCRSALEVGGDYYDLIQLENGHLGFAIGDVSGKGISAALIMASLRASLRSLILDSCGDLAQIMEKVNRLVYEASSSSRYATFFFSTYDPATRELRYVNAGHNPPILVCARTGECRRLEACGPVVGLLPLTFYEEQRLLLEPGDLLLAYTDGISEAMNLHEEEWGEERMLEAIPQTPATTAPEVLSRLFQAADLFTAGAPQHDDMTVLVMKLLTA